MRFTIGLATTFHDPALAIVGPDGEVLFAEASERYLQFKRAPHCEPDIAVRMPELARRYLRPGAEIVIATSWGAQFSEFLARRASVGNFDVEALAKLSGDINRSMVPQVSENAFVAALHLAQRHAGLGTLLGIHRAFGSADISLRRYSHHLTHAAYACFGSPFEDAVCLVVDGMGETGASAIYRYANGRVSEIVRHRGRESVGFYFGLVTDLCGFDQSKCEEWKVMGLAPYGLPRFIEQFREIVRTEENGQFRLNLDYFRHHAEGVEMSWDGGSPVIDRIFSDRFADTFGPPRAPGAALSDRDRDIAASLQLRLEEVAFHVLNHLHEQTGLTDLGLAGGVAYNSVMNGKILLNTPFRRVFVQPAAGDSGTSVGVCYAIDKGRQHMLSAYTGPEFSNEEIRERLINANLRFDTYNDEEITRKAAHDIASGMVVGWFQGRMEFGPRALGNRSIVVDPRRAEMKDVLNERIKKREPFRPFAPSILEERVGDYFEQTHPSPTMLMVYQVRRERRAEIPAVTHVDGSGRLQTVSRESNSRYYQLIADFGELTGVPVLLNTSFNENEPIVCTPDHAVDCFLKTRMDALYIGNHATRKL